MMLKLFGSLYRCQSNTTICTVPIGVIIKEKKRLFGLSKIIYIIICFDKFSGTEFEYFRKRLPRVLFRVYDV